MKQKKLFKKGVALTCMGAMLVSSATAFAAPSSTTGNSSVENDNSVAPNYLNCVLPTITSGTYDFTIDTEKLLPQYGNQADFDANSNVYFKAVNTAASAVAATNGKKFYELKEVKDTNAASIIGELVQTPNVTLSAVSFAKDYYVWQPDTSDATAKSEGKGKWTKITTANVEDFIELTIADGTNEITGASLRTDNLYGTQIWDGSIYVKDYVEITDANEVATYVTPDSTGGISSVSADLYVGDGTTAGTAPAAAADIKYTAAVFINKGESQPATIINKSSVPVIVNASITLPDDHGLTFQNSTSFGGVTAAAICMQLNDGTADTAVATTTDGTAVTEYYLLQGSTATPIKYQSAEIDTSTGSHNYYQYVPVTSDSDYAKVDFTLKAVANSEAGAKAAWADYIADLRSGDATKPDITVVYDFEKVSLDTSDAAKLTYTDASGATYTITNAGASEKATKTAATPTPTNAYGYFDANYDLWLAIDNDENDGGITDQSKLSNVKVGDTDGTAGAPSAPSSYTVEYGWIRIPWDSMKSCVTDNTTFSYTATFTYDGTDYTRTVTEQSTGPDAP